MASSRQIPIPTTDCAPSTGSDALPHEPSPPPANAPSSSSAPPAAPSPPVPRAHAGVGATNNPAAPRKSLPMRLNFTLVSPALV
ncbi:unnamed protein product [Linum trigynum]|uniref:Uncharacterized protein n=1 Tax=Linum trigynum TaxID=586398 RepID=A0AAV2EB90_9ROSI